MSNNITQIQRDSQIPVEIVNNRLNEKRLYERNPNEMTSRAGIWATNQLHKNNMRTRNSGFRDPMGLPMNTPFGQNPDFVHNQTRLTETETRPALSSLNATSNPIIIQKETAKLHNDSVAINQYIMMNTKRNPYSASRYPY